MAAKVAPTRVTPGPDEGVAVTRPKSQMNLSVGSKRAPPSGCVEKLKEWMRQMDFMDVLLDPYIKVTALPWKASVVLAAAPSRCEATITLWCCLCANVQRE